MGGQQIELVNDFLYLGGKFRNSEEEIAIRKKNGWTDCHSLKTIWKSDLRKDLKIRLFTATVESVLNGSETWSMTKRQTKLVDGCCTRMLRMALNIN